MIRGWHKIAKRQHRNDKTTMFPAALFQGLVLLPRFSYDMFTFNMSMVVVVQQSETPWSTAETLMAHIRTAAETKPALPMWSCGINMYRSGGGGGDKCHPSTETVGKIEGLLRQMEIEGGVEANVRSFTQLLQTWADSGVPEGPVKMEKQVIVAKIQNQAQCILLDNSHQGLGVQ
jgi:hypothetical protein